MPLSINKTPAYDHLETICSNIKAIRNTNNIPCVILPEKPHIAYEYTSKTFEAWMYANYQEFKNFNKKELQTKIKNLTQTTIVQFMGDIAGQAHLEKENKKLWLRCGTLNDVFYYNLGDGKTVYAMDKESISLVTEPRVYFQQDEKFSKVQCTPNLSAPIDSIFLLFNYVNITEKRDQYLLITYLISLFNPSISKFFLFIHGLPGAAKSTSLRFMRSLIDPIIDPSNELSDGGLIDFKHSSKDIYQQTNAHYQMYFDDIDYLSKSDQKTISKIVTGIVPEERQLYTTNERVLYDMKPCLAINGINLYLTESDTIERSLVIEINRIKKNKDKEEKILWTNFLKDKPNILGAMMQAFQKSLSIDIEFNPKERIRMKDAAIIMTKIAVAIGCNKDEFMEYLAENMSSQDEQAIEFSPVASTFIYNFDTATGTWEGSSSDLHKFLKKNLPEDVSVGSKIGEFPSSVKDFGGKLRMVINNLENLGFIITKTHKKSGTYYRIEKRQTQEGGANKQESEGGIDDIFS